jgi:hypothetical protein
MMMDEGMDGDAVQELQAMNDSLQQAYHDEMGAMEAKLAVAEWGLADQIQKTEDMRLNVMRVVSERVRCEGKLSEAEQAIGEIGYASVIECDVSRAAYALLHDMVCGGAEVDEKEWPEGGRPGGIWLQLKDH